MTRQPRPGVRDRWVYACRKELRRRDLGYYDQAGRLMFAAKTRNGFTPASRDQVFKRLKGIEVTATCPFVNLPAKRPGRWGQGITAENMAECVWLKPILVGLFEFVEWTPDGHLRHSRFVSLRD